MSRTINTTPVTVFMDGGGLHPTGITRHISCEAAMVAEESITVREQGSGSDCQGGTYPAGSIVPKDFPESVRTVKMVDADGMTLWIEYADYATFRTACEACCNPNP